jgi:hypothetical protein
VEKDQFIQVVHHFSGSSVEEAQDVLSLKASYPYSQLLHALSARVSKDHGFSTHSGELQLAAVYAADRAVLKEIMLEEFDPTDDGAQGPLATVADHTERLALSGKESTAGDDVAEEILHDLERLNELKLNFEKLFTDGPVVTTAPTEKAAETKSQESDAKDSQDGQGSDHKSGLTKKQRIIALARALEQRNSTEAPTTDVGKGKKKRKQEGEELIEEIVSSKVQIEPENEKQKEQIEMIDHFIKAAPSIVNSKDKPLPPPADDLSTAASEFGDNIISETLVEILVKQGKKDRAIEVLKKLIWKFPQKKAYFAAQIEDLKK